MLGKGSLLCILNLLRLLVRGRICIWTSSTSNIPLFLQLREKVRQTVEDIVHVAAGGMDELKESIFSKTAKTTDMECYAAAVRRFSEKCFKLSEVSGYRVVAVANPSLYLSVLIVIALGGPCYAPCVHPL